MKQKKVIKSLFVFTMFLGLIIFTSKVSGEANQVLLSDDFGVPGKIITLTGIGFTSNGHWSATFDGETLFEISDVDQDGILLIAGMIPTFYVPQVEAGIHEIVVLDVEEGIETIMEFEVTGETYLEIDPVITPADFNVTLTGNYWPEGSDVWFMFILYNDTEVWDVTDQIKVGYPGASFRLTNYGEINAWWIIPDYDWLSVGYYSLEVSCEDYLGTTSFSVTVPFTVTIPHIQIISRRSVYHPEDTIFFDISHSYGDRWDIQQSRVKIYDPSGDVMFYGDPLDFWYRTGSVWRVPYSHQKADDYPLILTRYAPLGEWVFTWIDNNGDTIDEGIFEVHADTDRSTDMILDAVYEILDITDEILDAIDDVQNDVSIIEYMLDNMEPQVGTARTVALNTGWNLIGLPFEPEDSSIEIILAEIMDNIESVWSFNGETGLWSSYSPGAPSDLSEMVEGKGYWVKMKTDVILIVYG